MSYTLYHFYSDGSPDKTELLSHFDIIIQFYSCSGLLISKKGLFI